MANAIYTKQGTPVVFKDSGGNVTMTLAGVDHGSGRVSAQWDRGASPWPRRHRVYCAFAMDNDHATVVGGSISVHLAVSDGTTVDGRLGTSDAALTDSNLLLNPLPIGSVIMDAANAADGTIMRGSFTVDIDDRYVSLVIWNGTTDKIKSGIITVTPCYEEVQ